ncbi:hypothetical protein L7F22_048713 [Adiantum nelumboides]|nr:hypothetical protein [Adiantum nelumboides]
MPNVVCFINRRRYLRSYFPKRHLLECSESRIWWPDKVDSLSVYAYIAKSKANEAWVEEKRKRDEEGAGTSNRATRSSTKKEEVPKPLPEVNMEDALEDKKQGKSRGPSYKLKSDIELATNLKKVFEERILNSKVEMTLGDILGIAKRKFHEEIIDIIKRKRKIPSDQEPEGVKSQVSEIEVYASDDESDDAFAIED